MPIRVSRDQRAFDHFPGLIAVFHALHRLLAPRHPPLALSSLAALIAPSTPWETGIQEDDRPTTGPSHRGDEMGRVTILFSLLKALQRSQETTNRPSSELAPLPRPAVVARDSQLLPLPNCQRTLTNRTDWFPIQQALGSRRATC